MSSPLSRLAWAVGPAGFILVILMTPGIGLTTAALAGLALAQWMMHCRAVQTSRLLAGLVLLALLPGFLSYVTPETLVATRQWLALAQAFTPDATLEAWRAPVLTTFTLMLLALALIGGQRAHLGAPVLLAAALLLLLAQLAASVLPPPRAALLTTHPGAFKLLALGALTLAQILMARRWWHGRPRIGRALLPATLLILVTLGLWQYQHHHTQNTLYRATQQAGAGFARQLSDDVSSHLEAMHRFAYAWRLLKRPPSARQWQSQASRLHDREFRYLLNIAFVRPDSRIDYIYPRNAMNRKVQGQRLFEVQPESRQEVQAAISGRAQTSTDVVELLQGGPGIIYYLPMHNAVGDPIGAAAMAISLPLLADTLFEALDPERALWVWHDNDHVLARFGNPDQLSRWSHHYRLDLSGQVLDVVQRPRRSYLLSRLSRLPAISLATGLILAYLLYMMLYTMRRLGEQNVALRHEVDERCRLQQEIEWLARHDELTGIANRRSFLEQLDARREAPPMSLILCDIDHFKRVNDQQGHLVGDEYLKAVAGIGQAVLEEYGGFFARYGGEEFIGCLPHTDHARALEAADTLRRRVCDRALLRADGSAVTLSAGVVTYSGGALDLAHLIQAADDALYRAKEQGRNRVASATPTTL